MINAEGELSLAYSAERDGPLYETLSKGYRNELRAKQYSGTDTDTHADTRSFTKDKEANT